MVPILVKNCELDLTKWQDCHRWCGDEVDCGKTGVTSVDFMEEVMGVEIILVQKYCGAIIFFGSHRNCYIFVHDCVQRLWALSLWRGCFPWPLHVMSRCRGICLSKFGYFCCMYMIYKSGCLPLWMELVLSKSRIRKKWGLWYAHSPQLLELRDVTWMRVSHWILWYFGE